ncbi:MAG: hypothetical protein K2M73_07775 [Lachnospiraceae bacterium]|nr:hypothetical protein [Lachnospiraceae bacterium]
MSQESSQYAIMDYIHIEGNYYMHKTKVIVAKDNKIIYDGVVNIAAYIETNESFVDISWDDKEQEKFYQRYNGRYSNTDIEFDNGKLFIHAIDKEDSPICITIY